MIESSKLPLPMQGRNALTESISIGTLLNSLWSCRLITKSGPVTNRYRLPRLMLHISELGWYRELKSSPLSSGVRIFLFP